VFALELAVAAFVIFAAGVIRDPRSFGNAVFLGLALALLIAALPLAYAVVRGGA
jgi:hypothetical protein